MAKQLYYASRPFDYGHGNGEPLDPGQIIELGGFRNDNRLIDLGLLRRVDQGGTTPGCGQCGRTFVGLPYLDMHGRKRHSSVALNARAEEDAAEAEDARLSAMLPLNTSRESIEVTTKRGPGRPRRASA